MRQAVEALDANVASQPRMDPFESEPIVLFERVELEAVEGGWSLILRLPVRRDGYPVAIRWELDAEFLDGEIDFEAVASEVCFEAEETLRSGSWRRQPVAIVDGTAWIED